MFSFSSVHFSLFVVVVVDPSVVARRLQEESQEESQEEGDEGKGGYLRQEEEEEQEHWLRALVSADACDLPLYTSVYDSSSPINTLAGFKLSVLTTALLLLASLAL